MAKRGIGGLRCRRPDLLARRLRHRPAGPPLRNAEPTRLATHHLTVPYAPATTHQATSVCAVLPARRATGSIGDDSPAWRRSPRDWTDSLSGPPRRPPTAGLAWYRVDMGAPKIWSAEELEKMSPNERQSLVRAGFETDLSKVSPELLERTRRKIESHIAANQDATTPDR